MPPRPASALVHHMDASGPVELLSPNQGAATLGSWDVERSARWCIAQWQVIGSVAPRLIALAESRDGLGSSTEAMRRLRDRAMAVELFARMQARWASRISHALSASCVPHALLKSAAVRYSYPLPWMRCGYDVDVGVAQNHIQRGQAALEELGFVPAEWSHAHKTFVQPDLQRRAVVEASHYELGFLARRVVARDTTEEQRQAIKRDTETWSKHPLWRINKEGDVECHMTVDVHHGLCLNISVEPLLEQSTKTTSGLSVPSRAWQLFHSIYKIYWEGVHEYRKGLYQYADLLRLLRDIAEDGASEVVALLRRHELAVAGFYVLRRVPMEWGLHLPTPLAELVRECASAPQRGLPSEHNDWGDMWPKLWGVR